MVNGTRGLGGDQGRAGVERGLFTAAGTTEMDDAAYRELNKMTGGVGRSGGGREARAAWGSSMDVRQPLFAGRFSSPAHPRAQWFEGSSQWRSGCWWGDLAYYYEYSYVEVTEQGSRPCWGDAHAVGR